MSDLSFMNVKCLVSTDLSHYFMHFYSCSVLPKFTALTLFYDVKRGKVVKVRYEINSVITA